MHTALTYARWADLTVGAEFQLTIGPVTRTNFVAMAGASGDFNPNHHDEIFAIRSGFDRVFAPATLQAGYMGRLLSEWVGPTALRTYRARYTAQLWPGDLVICKATIVNQIDEGGERRVEIEGEAVNQRGDVLLTVHASAVPVA